MLGSRRLFQLLCVFLLSSFAAGSALAWGYSVSVSGNTIHVTISGLKDDYSCCGGASFTPHGGASCSIPCGNPKTATITCNRQGANTIFVYAADETTRDLPGGPYETRMTTVNVPDPPPPTCPAFNFFALTNRAITHKYGTEPWVTGQSRDAQVELMFRPVRVEAGTQIYVKVTDPQDPSTYKPAPTTPGPDNIDTGAGRLALSPSDTGAATLTFTAPTSGNQTIYLNTTGFAGGDNYVVKATPDPQLHSDPNFVCGPATNCQESGTITAWKRVYLEKKRMFRNGLFIAAPAPAGSNQVIVQIPEGRRWRHVRLNPGAAIQLMHAKRLDGLDASGFYSEDAVVTDVDRVPGARNQRLLTLAAPLVNSYDRDTTYAEALADGVSDGVGNIAAGVFDQYTWLLNSAFGEAFVEFRDLEQSASEIPYVPVVRQPHRIANKWFEHTTVSAGSLARPGNSNVKHVLAGTGIPDPTGGRGVSLFHYGETGLYTTGLPIAQIPQPNYSWTWALAIEAATGHGGPLAGLDPATVHGENVVHELAHAFNVNSIYYSGADYGHCGNPMANDPTLNCLMMAPGHPSFDVTQKGDGKVGFHYNSDNDSEYMTISAADGAVPDAGEVTTMNTMKRMLMLCALAAVAVTSMAAPSPTVQVTLTIPNEALAGVSVPLDIRVRNGGSAVELAPTVSVRATSPVGETFTARWGEHIEVGPLELGLTDEDAETLAVKPKSTVELAVPAVPLTDTSWAHDPRIAGMPGKWTLEVVLLNERDGSKLTSNAATLVVNAPPAKDVWIVQALARGELWEIAERVLSEHPDSPYFPYISTAVRRLSSLEKIDIINRAMTLHPDSPVVPRLRYAIAEYYGAEAHRVFFGERDFDKAVSLAEKGRAELARLKNSSDPWSKLIANQREDDFPSRAGYVELQRLQREKGSRKP